MSLQGERLPSFREINWIASIHYFIRVTRGKLSGKLTRSLPDDALSHYFGSKESGDNSDLRSRLLLEHFFVLYENQKLGSRIPETYYVFRSNEARYELRALIKDHPFCILVFVGLYPDHDKDFQDAFERFKKTIPEQFNRYLITNQYDISAYDEDDDVLGDYDAEVHHQLHIPLSMIYIVDTDGVVVWRSTRDQQQACGAFMKKLENKTSKIENIDKEKGSA